MAQLQKKLSVFGIQLVRQISTTACVSGKRNFRKFPLYNKRGTKVFKAQQFKKPDPNIPIYDYGARPIGYVENGKFVKVPEMIPEIMVPDLTGFQLKPYVSYRAEDVVIPPLTPEDLFAQVYGSKITADYEKGKLGPDGQPLEPSSEELLTPEEAKARVMRLSSDII